MKLWKLPRFNNFRYFESRRAKREKKLKNNNENLQEITYENCNSTQMKIYDQKTKKILIKNYAIQTGKLDGTLVVSLCIHNPYKSHEILKNSYNLDTYLKNFKKNCKKCYEKLYDLKNKACFEIIDSTPYDFPQCYEDLLLKTDKPKELIIYIGNEKHTFILTKKNGIQPKNNRFFLIS